MPKTIEISQDQIKRCVELNRDGWNFTKIGKDVGLDRRKVAEIIRSRQEAEMLEQVAAARRDVAGTYFRQHIEDIELARSYLLQIVVPPSMRIGLNNLLTDVAGELLLLLKKQFLDREFNNPSTTFKSQMAEAAGWQQPEYKLVLDTRTAEREARQTIEGFKEHLPSLWPKVKAWEQAADRYNVTLQEKYEKFKKFAVELGVQASVAGTVIPVVLKLIFEKGYPDEEEMYYSTSHRLNTVAKAAEHLRRTPRTRHYLDMLVSSWRELGRTFNEIEDMVSPNQLHRALLRSHCQFCPVQ